MLFVCHCLMGILFVMFVLADLVANEFMQSAADCRQYFGGPFNPKFDVVKGLNISLMRVRCACN